jgi:hypothetical protein
MKNEQFVKPKAPRIRVVRSSSEKSWYNDFIDKEFNVIKVFLKSVEISPPNNFTKYIKYYILNGDYIIVGDAKGGKKRHDRCGDEFKVVKYKLSGYKINTNRSVAKRPWNYSKREMLLQQED